MNDSASWPADLPIIDPHHHLWDLEANSYPWLQQEPPPQLVCGDIRPIRHSYTAPSLKADIGDLPVTKTVHLQCDWDPTDPVGETRWLDAHADTHGLPTAFVAYARLQDDDVESVLAGHAQFSRLRGIRQIMNWHADAVLTFGAPRELMRSAAWRRGYAALARYGLSFDLQLYPGQMPEAVEIATLFPDTQIILNHGGMPVDRTPEGIAAWRAGMRSLAALPNVAVKISGLGMLDHAWTTARIRPFVLDIIEIFGTERSAFASNFPVDSLYSGYRAVWNAFLDIVSGFSLAEKRALFAGTAERLYRI